MLLWGAQSYKRQSRIRAPFALDNMEEAQFIFCLLNSLVQGLFSSRKFTQICDYTEQKFRLHQYWLNGDDDTFVSAILDSNRRVRVRQMKSSSNAASNSQRKKRSMLQEQFFILLTHKVTQQMCISSSAGHTFY